MIIATTSGIQGIKGVSLKEHWAAQRYQVYKQQYHVYKQQYERLQHNMGMKYKMVSTVVIRAVYRIFAKGGKLGVCQKEGGGEAVRSCRAAAGGWVQEGDVPPPAQLFYLSEIHLHEL